MTDIDLDAIDPNNLSEEELEYLSEGKPLMKRMLMNSGGQARDRIAMLKHRRDQEATSAAANVQHDPDLIPDNPYEDRDDSELDRVIDSIDILDAYIRWCGKMVPEPGGRREGIKIRCPNPWHEDKRPDAWVNLDKQTWVCGPCGMMGGDKHDLAAIAKGFAYPNTYKTDGTFPELRRQMAADYGFIVRRSPTGEDIVEEMEVVYESDPEDPNDDDTPPEPPPGGSEEPDNPDNHPDTPPILPVEMESVWALPAPDGITPTPAAMEEAKAILRDAIDQEASLVPIVRHVNPLDMHDDEPDWGAPVVQLRPDPDALLAKIAESDLGADALPWEDIIPENTFLHEYMTQNCKYDIPHEFHFWLGIILIAFANGFRIRIEDVPPINTNLYVVLVGPTGLGKSRATMPMRTLMREVLPWTGTESMPGKGVKMLGGIESGQALIKGIMHEYEDPAPASGIPGLIQQPNVRALTMPEEFAGFVKKAMRLGSDFKERAIEFFDMGRDGEVSINAVKYGGEVKALGPYLQVVSTTQPDAIHTYLSAEDTVSGFLNRFVFVMGPSREERPSRWTRAHAPDLTRSVAGLKALVEFCEHHEGLDLPYTPAGDAAWTHLYGHIERLKVESGPMAVRLDLILKKVMGCFAINEHRTEIDADLVERMEPIMNHLLANYTRITGDLYWRPDDACQDAILEYVRTKNENGQHPRKKEIVDSLKRNTPGRSRFDLGRALDLLEKLEIIKVVKVKNARGPDRTGFKINHGEAEAGEVTA